MSAPAAGFSRFVAQLRAPLGRTTTGALIAVCVGLLVLGKTDMKLAAWVQARSGDLVGPVLGTLIRPVDLVRDRARRLGELLAVWEENDRLREENRRLLAWQAEAARLSVQNRGLRDALGMPRGEAAPGWTAARVVGDSGGPFVHAVLVDAGHERGVAEGMPALTPRGVAGRVVAVGRQSARLLLITDLNSKLPVIVERSRDRAILEGDNGPEPTLRFLPANADLAVGDRVLTSGDGGLVPAGLLVGRVSAVREGRVTVRPFVDWEHLDVVSILRAERLPDPALEPLHTSG